MGETLRAQHGDNVAKVYEALKTDLLALDEKYPDIKDKFGSEHKASYFYRYTFEPVNLIFQNDPTNELKHEIKAVFDRHLGQSHIQ